MSDYDELFRITGIEEIPGHRTHFIVVKCPAGQCPVLVDNRAKCEGPHVISPNIWDLVFYFEPGQAMISELWFDTGVEFESLTQDLQIFCFINEYRPPRQRPGQGTVTIGAGSGGGAEKKVVPSPKKFKPAQRLCSKTIKIILPCFAPPGYIRH